MLRIYRRPAQDEPLSQGDIFVDVPNPDISFDPAYELCDEPGTLREKRVDGKIQDKMNFVATVDLTAAVVLEQSCDCLKADTILLAPLDVYEPDKDQKTRHREIKALGSSFAQPTRIYLAQEPDLNMPKYLIDLGRKFTLSREDMEHFLAQGHRCACLGEKNLLYLQSRLASAFTRPARDDLDWMGEDDLADKIAVLESEVSKKRDRIKSKEARLLKLVGGNTGIKDVEDLQDEIEADTESLRATETELSAAHMSKEKLLEAPASYVTKLNLNPPHMIEEHQPQDATKSRG